MSPAAIASCRRRWKRRRRINDRRMMAQEMASNKKRVARKVNLEEATIEEADAMAGDAPRVRGLSRNRQNV